MSENLPPRSDLTLKYAINNLNPNVSPGHSHFKIVTHSQNEAGPISEAIAAATIMKPQRNTTEPIQPHRKTISVPTQRAK